MADFWRGLLFDLTEYEQASVATYYLFKVSCVELTERKKDENALIEKMDNISFECYNDKDRIRRRLDV